MIRTGTLSTPQRDELLALVRSGDVEHRVARRANAVLLLDDGWSCEEAAKVLYVDDDTVRTWGKIYTEHGVSGLQRFEVGGSASRLSAGQEDAMKAHNAQTLSRSPREIGPFIAREPVAHVAHHHSRGILLASVYIRLCSELSIKPNVGANIDMLNSEAKVPHAYLRRVLQSDPAMAALLPATHGRLTLGRCDEAPFFLTRSGLLRLSPALLNDSAALSIATRWGNEASHLQSNELLTIDTMHAILCHGRSLMRAAPYLTREVLLSGVPSRIVQELLSDGSEPPSDALIAWQRSLIESMADAQPTPATTAANNIELWNSVEALLAAGGDTRLAVDQKTGFNRYGATPRPRPEALQFSSSTASSISDYSFMYCDLLRRDLLAAMLREELTPQELRARAVDAMAAGLLQLLGLKGSEADVALAPSGTDTEMLAVLVGIASNGSITNILIAPEETGRGVREAAGGRFFDSRAASGKAIEKGEAAWPQADIEVVEIPIRDEQGSARVKASIADDVRRAVGSALAKGRRVLLHLLASSKTGLGAPTEDAVEKIVEAYPALVDVVVDACQMRTPFLKIGEWVRKGWMVQVSGSKFLTGPPFSGALILPHPYRSRAPRIWALLNQSPSVGFLCDWTSGWHAAFPNRTSRENASFGMIFRWFSALLEAELFNSIPDELRQTSIDRFHRALCARLDNSQWLVRMSDDERGEAARCDILANSIICFSVVAPEDDGVNHILDAENCRKIFHLLNQDLSSALGPLSAKEAALAGMQAHIGQPVSLNTGSQSVTLLRMVLGARFFSIVAHAGAGFLGAALESEISDAVRVLEKLELLAKMWPKAKFINT